MEHIATSRAYQSRAVPLAKETSATAYVFRGPELKRLTAEQFLDAVWMLTGTAPGEADRAGGDPAVPRRRTPKERQFVRATLVDCDPLMRSLGRPNREQVVTTRPDQLTTLQALDLANGQILTTTLDARRGEHPEGATRRRRRTNWPSGCSCGRCRRKPTDGERAAARGTARREADGRTAWPTCCGRWSCCRSFSSSADGDASR